MQFTVTRVISAFLIGISGSTAWAWPGFTWEAWQESTGVQAPELSTRQAGNPALLPLLDGAEGPITTVAAWEAKRDGIKQTLSTILGTPTDIVRDTGAVEILGEEKLPEYTRIHLRVPGEAGDPIPAYLLLPKEPVHQSGHPAAGPTPAMIVLHQTQAPGKQEACGMVGNPDMAFADELAKRGYICIVPDVIGFGERIPEGTQPYHDALAFYARHPQWSFFGKMSYDLACIVDYLETRPEVDAKAIGVIGHSHGAYGSIMGTIFEPRINFAVASCGFNTLRTDNRPDRWSNLTALMPRLGFYVEDIKEAPLDWHEIIAAIAPRPYFNWATLEDDIFPNTDNLADIYTQLTNVYGLYGAADKFHGELVPGKHRFPKEGRDLAYTWIDTQFGIGRN